MKAIAVGCSSSKKIDTHNF